MQLDSLLLLNIYADLWDCLYAQEKAAALAENRVLPPLHGSADVRPINLDDFKSAHQQVRNKKNICASLNFDLLVAHPQPQMIEFWVALSIYNEKKHVINRMLFLMCRYVQVYPRSQQIWMSCYNGTNCMEKVDPGRRNSSAISCEVNQTECIATESSLLCLTLTKSFFFFFFKQPLLGRQLYRVRLVSSTLPISSCFQIIKYH